MNWKSEMSFGKHKGSTLIAVLSSDKDYLAWCFFFHMEDKYPELRWIKENIKPKEMQSILSLQKNEYE